MCFIKNDEKKVYHTDKSFIVGQVATQDQSTPFVAPKSGSAYIVELSVMVRMHAAVQS